MLGTARRTPAPGRAGLGLALLLLALSAGADGVSLRGQAPPTEPVSRLLAADAERWLDHEDPVVRGEAALVVAAGQDPAAYEQVLAVARDDAEEASLRGILALGYLGTPSARLALEQLLEESRSRPQPAGITAAFALATMPPDTAASSVSAWLVRLLGTSLKRQRDLLLAMLAALAVRDPVHQRAALQRLADDAAVRDDEVRAALLTVLGRIPDGLAPELVETTLRKGSPAERLAVLRALGRTGTAPPGLTGELERTVGHDGDPRMRAAALAVLTRLRHLPALEMAARAVRAGEPVEVAQGTRTALQLGGSGMRRALERQLGLLGPAAQAALLEAFHGPMSDEFRARCLELAGERRLPLALRTAAALCVAQAGPPEAPATGPAADLAPLMRDLFLANEDRATLRALAAALLAVHDAPPELERLHMGAPVGGPALSADRLGALLAAGHPGAARHCLVQLQRTDLAPAAAAEVLRAVRTALLPGPGEVAGLPAPVAGLLR